MVNLLPELGTSVGLERPDNWLWGKIQVRRDSDQGLGGIVEEPRRRERAPRPSEGTPNGGTQVLAVCVTPGQLNDCVALVLQQDGEQSALRERESRG